MTERKKNKNNSPRHEEHSAADDEAMRLLIDGAHYGRLLLRPSRAGLFETWWILQQDGDVRESWERLAARGVISHEWLERGPAVAQPDLTILHHPTSSDEVLAFASDAAGINACTHLGRELARALSAWNVCEPTAEIQWIVRPRQSWAAQHLHPLVRLHATTSMRKASLFDRVRLDFIGAAVSCPSVVMTADLVRFAALWRATAMFTREQPGYAAALAPIGFEKTPFAQWPDPWGPWLEILALGYAVESYERSVLTLVAPQYSGGAPAAPSKRAMRERSDGEL